MKSKLYSLLITGILLSGCLLVSCNKDDEQEDLPNELGLVGSATQQVVEGDVTTVTVNYEFLVPARKAGSATIGVVTNGLTYGTNYTTTPAEVSGSITLPFEIGDPGLSFTITVVDDNSNLPDGSVTFSLNSIEGENSTIATGAATFALTIIDNEGESINPASESSTALGEVVPGTQSPAKQVSFTTVNVVSDMTATASAGFVVSATSDGTYATTATLALDATSFYVKAAPTVATPFGPSTGTVTVTVAQASATFDVDAIVSSGVGELFWAEYFDYPIDETYPSYATKAENWGILPTSAYFRHSAAYNGTELNNPKPTTTGLQRSGNLDTWYGQTRMTGLGLGDNPLTFTGFPQSGTGRKMVLGIDDTNFQTNNNTCNWEYKNAAVVRRFVENGSEIKSGNVYMAAMMKVNEVFPEATPVLKNAVIMLTGDASFVGLEAMKLNVRDNGSGGFNFGVSKSGDDGSVVYGATNYELGKTYAIMMKVEIKADLQGNPPNDVITLYVFEEGETIPNFEDPALVAEAKIDETNQGGDVHDVINGLETVFIREVADAFAAGGRANIEVQKVEFDGIRVATSWYAALKHSSEALYDNVSADKLQSIRTSNINCTGLTGPNTANNDL